MWQILINLKIYKTIDSFLDKKEKAHYLKKFHSHFQINKSLYISDKMNSNKR